MGLPLGIAEAMHEVHLDPLPLDRLVDVIGTTRGRVLTDSMTAARTAMAGGTVWHVNATARGGGVAEMLPRLVGYSAAVGVRTRWVVLDGNPDFFAVTKRLHNRLHGEDGDGGRLGPEETACYERVSAENLADFAALVEPGDVVILHDPQTAGLAAGLRSLGARVIWRSHIGADRENDNTDAGWAFLRPYVEPAEACVFSRSSYVPAWLDGRPVEIIPPSIDPCSPKNQPLAAEEARRLLVDVGLLAGAGRSAQARCRLVNEDGPPPPDARLIVQVSRWDRLKDMPGVLTSFAKMTVDGPADAQLMLVGPDGGAVADDPEAAEVFEECRTQWCDLPAALRRRIHVVGLPIDDVEWNARAINALQCLSAIVVQKSLVEGFGLTVTEAMWKSKPVIASRVGGIQDQITDGHDGLLVDDPMDLDAAAAAMARVLSDPPFAGRLGAAAHAKVRDEFLDDRHLIRHAELLLAMTG
jgi:trehalose synthase